VQLRSQPEIGEGNASSETVDLSEVVLRVKRRRVEDPLSEMVVESPAKRRRPNGEALEDAFAALSVLGSGFLCGSHPH
jgi:hypothetical protein